MCTNPEPKGEGLECEGSYTETKPCQMPNCPSKYFRFFSYFILKLSSWRCRQGSWARKQPTDHEFHIIFALPLNFRSILEK